MPLRYCPFNANTSTLNLMSLQTGNTDLMITFQSNPVIGNPNILVTSSGLEDLNTTQVIFNSGVLNTLTSQPDPSALTSTISTVPEPSTLVLAALAFAGLAVPVLRRRRRCKR